MLSSLRATERTLKSINLDLRMVMIPTHRPAKFLITQINNILTKWEGHNQLIQVSLAHSQEPEMAILIKIYAAVPMLGSVMANSRLTRKRCMVEGPGPQKLRGRRKGRARYP